MKTIQEIFDTLSSDQMNRVYLIIGDILNNNRTMDATHVNLNFLSNVEQKEAVRMVVEQAIVDNKREMKKEKFFAFTDFYKYRY